MTLSIRFDLQLLEFHEAFAASSVVRSQLNLRRRSSWGKDWPYLVSPSRDMRLQVNKPKITPLLANVALNITKANEKPEKKFHYGKMQ